MAAARRLEWLNKMIGWERGASFLDQSHSEVKQHLNENCVIIENKNKNYDSFSCVVTCDTHLASQTALHCISSKGIMG